MPLADDLNSVKAMGRPNIPRGVMPLTGFMIWRNGLPIQHGALRARMLKVSRHEPQASFPGEPA